MGVEISPFFHTLRHTFLKARKPPQFIICRHIMCSKYKCVCACVCALSSPICAYVRPYIGYVSLVRASEKGIKKGDKEETKKGGERSERERKRKKENIQTSN